MSACTSAVARMPAAMREAWRSVEPSPAAIDELQSSSTEMTSVRIAGAVLTISSPRRS